MKLYLVHCGFSEMDLCQGFYEFHVDLFVVSESFDNARKKVKEIPEFLAKKMHVDSIQEIMTVQGYAIELNKENHENTVINSHRNRTE